MAKRRQKVQFDDALQMLMDADTLPVYAVTGDEEQRKAEAVAALKAKALGDADPGMCYTEYEGDTVDCKDVFDDLRTLPFLGDRRVVLLEKADKFIERFGDQFKSYLESPSTAGTLIMVLNNLDSRTKVAKTLAKWQSVVECKRLYDNQVPDWIRKRVASLGKQIDLHAARMLGEHVGADLGPLASQVDKLVTYVGDRDRITLEDVAEMTVTDRTRTIFELTDCIGRKDSHKAIGVLNQFMHRDGEAGYVVTMLAWQMRRLWKTKKIVANNPRARESDLISQILKAVGGAPMFIKQMIPQARAFSDEDLAYRHRLLIECDAALKSTGDDPKTMLEVLMMRLCK